MSVDIKTVTFENREVHLSSQLADGPPFTVHGIALGEGDVTRGASGIEKYWPADELEKAADSLEGKNLVEDHENNSRGVVGEVTKSGYKEGVGILYEAELFDDELAERISNGLLEVSIRGFHKDVDEMEETEDGTKIVEDIEFDNLSIVPSGASPSNTLEMGPAEELSVAALSEYVGDISAEELQEVEPGMWVEWSDGKGITISQVEDGEIEVDVYEESDGKWRSTGNTKMLDTDSLSEWDVDEEEDIGPREEDEEDESEEDSEEEASKHKMDPDVEDDEESEAAKHTHRDTLDKLEDFLTADANDSTTAISDFEEWADMDAVSEVVSEFTEFQDFSMGSNVGDLKKWLEAIIGVDDEEENTHTAEGEEEVLDSTSERQEQAGEHRNPDGSFDDEYEEASADDGSSEESDVEELQEWEMHDVDWEGTTENDWSSPDFEDFREPYNLSDDDMFTDLDEEMRGAIAEHFIISQTGFPPENFTGLALPVVEPSGELNVNALAAVKGGRGVTAVDGLPEDMEEAITEMVNDLANEEFDRSWGMEENAQSFSDYPEAAKENAKMALDARDETDNPNDCGTDVGWQRANQLASGESLSMDTVKRMAQFNRHRQNSDMDDEEGKADCGWMMWKAWGGDEGVDWAKQKVQSEENAISARNTPTDSAEPTHEMDPIGASLDMINAFLRANGRDERESVDKMLGWLFSSTDVPTEKVAAFRTAANAFLDQQGGADSFSSVKVDSFRDWLLTQGGQTNDGTNAKPTDGSGSPKIATPVHILSGDDLRTNGASKMDSKSTIEVLQNMTNIEDELEELDDPVAVEHDDLEELQEKADRMDEMSETLESLKERTDVLDSVDSEKVDELAEGDDPIVIESEEYEELTAEAEQVKTIYAEALAGEDSPFSAEELTDKFSIEELREKYDEAGHDLEDELSAEPKSGDVDEEELEERAEEEEQSEEELEREEEIESKQAELRDKILGGD